MLEYADLFFYQTELLMPDDPYGVRLTCKCGTVYWTYTRPDYPKDPECPFCWSARTEKFRRTHAH